MSGLAAPPLERRPGLAARLWTYQAERFPVVRHGALIAAFGASAVCLSALLRGATPQPAAIVVAVLVLFGFFLQLRVADEHKDHAEDSKYRPERPVPRGLVTLAELRAVAVAAGVLQLGLTLALSWTLVIFLAAVWAFMALMAREFFVASWLRKRPLAYMVSHLLVMPLIDLYATACDWWVAGTGGRSGFGMALAGFLALSLVNGAALEIARKSWAPHDEREGVETYSKAWGPGRAGAAVMSLMIAGLALAAFVNVQSGASIWFLAGLMALTAWAAWCAIDYAGTPTSRKARLMELASGLFVMGNYLLLGVGPLLALWLS